eukprot:1180530-Prorocentrum_minimum.AAC.11
MANNLYCKSEMACHPMPLRVDSVPKRVDSVPQRVDSVPQRVDSVPQRVDSVPQRAAPGTVLPTECIPRLERQSSRPRVPSPTSWPCPSRPCTSAACFADRSSLLPPWSGRDAAGRYPAVTRMPQACQRVKNK